MLLVIEVLNWLLLFFVSVFVARWTAGPFIAPSYPTVEKRIGASVLTVSETVEVKFANDGGDSVLTGNLGVSLGVAGRSVLCDSKITDNDVTCRWQKKGIKVLAKQLPMIPRVKCTNFYWIAATYWDVLKDCFRLRSAHWYGGAEHFYQMWPIEKASRQEAPYVTGDMIHNPELHYGGVSERFWLSSRGAAIIVNPYIPLYVSLNDSGDGRLCFSGKNGNPYRNDEHSPPILEYTICVGDSILSVFQDVFKMFFRLPTDIPIDRMFMYPTWSTWAIYRENVSAELVKQLATKIVDLGFPRGTISIDDNWERCYGDLEFDKTKFPDPKELVDTLRTLRFQTALWVHPFCNRNCTSYREGIREGYWVKGASGKTVRTNWWKGQGGLLDVTNIDSVMWWTDRLANIQDQYGINAFKFDAGESNWLPRTAQLASADNLYPNIYTTKYAEASATRFGRSSELRVGFRTQHLPVFVRMSDKSSSWNASNGLKTVIPTALHYGIIGYPFVFPEMIGGSDETYPSRELFIRWFQVSAFLPALHLSIPPWRYGRRTVEICKKIMDIRMKYSQMMVALAHKSTQDGSPIVRPLWWISPKDQTAHVIDSEFLVGDTLLVAPILEHAATSRNIYLPVGNWQDELRGTLYKGPLWLRQYKIELHEVALFTRFTKPKS